MHLFHRPTVDFLAREGQCLLVQSDEVLAGREWVEGWVVGETIHVRIQVVEHISDREWAPSWLQAVQVLRQNLRRDARKHIYLVSIRRPVEFIPLLDRLLEQAPTRGEVDRGQGLLDPAHCREQLRQIGRTDLAQGLAQSLKKGDLLHLQLECQGDTATRFLLRVHLQDCRQLAPGEESEELNASPPPRYGQENRYRAVDLRTELSLRLTGVTRAEKGQ